MTHIQTPTETMVARIVSYTPEEGGKRLVVEAPNEDLADTFASMFCENEAYGTINTAAETTFSWDDVEVYSETSWGYLIMPDPNYRPRTRFFLESDSESLYFKELTSSFINPNDSWSADQMKLINHVTGYRLRALFEMEERWQDVQDEKFPKGKLARIAAEEARKERYEIERQERRAKMTPKELEAEDRLPF